MIPINKPWLGTDEKNEILSVLDDGILTSAAKDGGKRVRDFEFELRNFLKVNHVIAVNSGTAALYAALLAADIKKDDEVLLPSFTFVATANSVAAIGA
ncbi:MAG TPA: DegT/DnrJ/EryC1/StrS family aminotransferase, partial [Nitrososphaeraceae archaeon]|nr:DegT/DnrJ/EryC1/StrS family aminotransferase [Nitrososphaeraceae archaeon]